MRGIVAALMRVAAVDSQSQNLSSQRTPGIIRDEYSDGESNHTLLVGDTLARRLFTEEDLAQLVKERFEYWQGRVLNPNLISVTAIPHRQWGRLNVIKIISPVSEYIRKLHLLRRARRLLIEVETIQTIKFDIYMDQLSWHQLQDCKEIDFEGTLTKIHKALDIYELLLGTDHSLTVDVKKKHANLLFSKGYALLVQLKCNEALATFRECFTICESVYGTKHGNILAVHFTVWFLMCKQNNSRETLDSMREYLAERKSIHEPSHPKAAKEFYNLGCCLMKDSKYEEALAIFSVALFINNIESTLESTAKSCERIGKPKGLLRDSEFYHFMAIRLKKYLDATMG